MMIEDELKALTTADGFIRPRDVVKWAEDNPQSALHAVRDFHWDNDVAAAGKWRIEVARRLISIHVRADDGTRATISLIQDRNPNGGYRHLEPVLQNAELRAMAVRQAMREFNGWKRRYEHLRELAVVFDAANGIDAPAEPQAPAA